MIVEWPSVSHLSENRDRFPFPFPGCGRRRLAPPAASPIRHPVPARADIRQGNHVFKCIIQKVYVIADELNGCIDFMGNACCELTDGLQFLGMEVLDFAMAFFRNIDTVSQDSPMAVEGDGGDGLQYPPDLIVPGDNPIFVWACPQSFQHFTG